MDLHETQQEHESQTSLLCPRQLKLPNLVKWQAHYYQIASQIGSRVCSPECMDIEALSWMVPVPDFLHWLTFKEGRNYTSQTIAHKDDEDSVHLSLKSLFRE